jgi:hypothetical protein
VVLEGYDDEIAGAERLIRMNDGNEITLPVDRCSLLFSVDRGVNL